MTTIPRTPAEDEAAADVEAYIPNDDDTYSAAHDEKDGDDKKAATRRKKARE